MRWLPSPLIPAPRAGGFVTTQFVLVVAFSLLLFVMLCNAIVYQYGRGVIRSALDEGVRSGSRASGSAATCQAAAEEVRHSLLGGPIGAHVSLRCGLVAGQVHATARKRSDEPWVAPGPACPPPGPAGRGEGVHRL